MTTAALVRFAAETLQQTPTMARSADPFFSNDLPGLFKVLGTFGTMLGVMIAFLARLTQGRYEESQKKLKGDIDKVGERVNATETNVTRLTERANANDITIREHTFQLGAFRETMGALTATVGAIQTQGNQMQRDIMTALTESARVFDQQMNAIRVEVARLQERDRLADTLESLLRQQQGNGGGGVK